MFFVFYYEDFLYTLIYLVIMANLILNPDIYGDRIVFICCDDLWEYDLVTREKRRLVTGLGVINNARYYDNGRKVVFRVMTGESLSSADLYTIDLSTGSVRRLTYLSGKSVGRRMFTDIAGFGDDGSIIVSTDVFSPFVSMTFLYKLSEDGKKFDALNYGPAIHIMFKENMIYIGRNTFDLPHWKEYRGGTRGNIWRGNVESGFEKIVDLENHLSCPVVLKDRIYFITDLDGSGQIYSTDLSGNGLRTHTKLEDYYPRHLNTDGKNLVFSSGGRLYILHPENDSVDEVSIGSISESDDILFSSTSKYLDECNINDDELVSFVARGQAFVTDSYLNYHYQVPDALRIRYVRFAGSKIVYVLGTSDGDTLKIYDYQNDSTDKIDYDFGNIFSLKTSIDGKYALLGNDRFEIILINLGERYIKVIDRSEEDMILDFVISHDSRFVAYSFPLKSSFLGSYAQRSIKMYDILNDRIYWMTSSNSNDYSPSFDSESRYLYYLSNRSLDPSADKLIFNFSYNSISKPFVIPLRVNDVNPSRIMSSKFIGNPGDYDLDNASLRSTVIDLEKADYRSIIPTDKGIYLFSVTPHGEFSSYYFGTKEKGSLQKYDFVKKELKDIKKSMTDFSFSSNLKKMLFRKEDQKIYLIDLEKPDEERIFDVDRIKLRGSRSVEFEQMYEEALKLAKDNYWDERKANETVLRVSEKYRRLLPLCRTRFDLSYVITEMQGEFRTSHSYETIGHGTNIEASEIGKLGADFSYENHKYVLRKIYCGDPSNENEKSPLLFSNRSVKEGDIIEEIDGIKVGEEYSLYEVLLNKAGKTIKLKLRGSGSSSYSIYVDTLEDDRYIRYRSWVENNRKYVHKRTENKVGYVHIPDMGMMGLNEFYKLYVNELSYSGMIVDVRYNGGGFVSQLILEKLLNRHLGYDKPRRGSLHPYPTNSVRGPMIAITNEYAGSDGDIFSYSFKALKLGKLIGVRTWGGVVGISPRRKLIDGSVLTQPEYSFWFERVGYGVENHGVDPDIEVQYTPMDYYLGKDPQLDYAITSIMTIVSNNGNLPT